MLQEILPIDDRPVDEPIQVAFDEYLAWALDDIEMPNVSFRQLRDFLRVNAIALAEKSTLAEVTLLLIGLADAIVEALGVDAETFTELDMTWFHYLPNADGVA
ncbi:hypothetical protein [Devosia sp. RR2S18]|uniref:hypothetical protein n=1 Tax=Devosia rhizosphaerae TaxID=3049774 RepID=UPI0025409ABF|nr:hypothetical protein [Devosia sp. RR2S18]WIJ25771.1 hypothetical protein QOV41_03135 [Devosia sp. RR2S18]